MQVIAITKSALGHKKWWSLHLHTRSSKCGLAPGGSWEILLDRRFYFHKAEPPVSDHRKIQD